MTVSQWTNVIHSNSSNIIWRNATGLISYIPKAPQVPAVTDWLNAPMASSVYLWNYIKPGKNVRFLNGVRNAFFQADLLAEPESYVSVSFHILHIIDLKYVEFGENLFPSTAKLTC